MSGGVEQYLRNDARPLSYRERLRQQPVSFNHLTIVSGFLPIGYRGRRADGSVSTSKGTTLDGLRVEQNIQNQHPRHDLGVRRRRIRVSGYSHTPPPPSPARP